MGNPVVMRMGLIGALGIGCFYALNLSAPAMLMAGTGWDITHVGYLTSLAGVVGALSMLLTGALSDKRGSRFGILTAASLLMAAGCAILALASTPAAVILGYMIFMLAWSGVTTGMVLLWGDLLPQSSLAVGCAAINSLNFVGGFIGPYLWGWAKDQTGSYTLALSVMAVAMVMAAALVLALRRHAHRPRAMAIMAAGA